MWTNKWFWGKFSYTGCMAHIKFHFSLKCFIYEKMDIHQSFFYFTLSWCYYYFADTALVGSLFFTLGSHKNTTEELLGKIIDCKCQRIINNNSIDSPFLGIDEKAKKRIENKLYYYYINFVDWKLSEISYYILSFIS